jgi:ribose-phosphate pyrophosphokinase
MLEVMGVDRVITVEFYPPGHGQTDGFFKEPNTTIDNLEVTDVAVKHFCSKQYERPLVIISPNPEFVQKAHDFARGMRDSAVRFGRPLEVRVALALKPSSASDRMYGSSGNLEILGDVEGCDVVIVDDVIDTGRTLRTTSRRLKECGAERIFVFATHGLFNGDCLRMLDGCAIDEIVVTDTIPAFEANENMPTEKVVRLGVATRLAQAISDVYQRRSIQYLSYREDTDIGRYYGQDSQIDVADVEEDADRVVELGEEEGEGATAQA